MINVFSTFNGYGSIWLALDNLGVEVGRRYSSEIDKYAIKINDKNYPGTIQLGDITKIHANKLNPIDLFVGGSPCQGFSFAGKQLNFDDERSKLFFEYVRLLEEIRVINPDVIFLLENVRMKKEYQDEISRLLGVEPILINSALVSAQNRNRLYWTNIEGIQQPGDKGIVLKDILEDHLGNPVKDTDRNKRHYRETNQKSLCMTASMYKGAGNNGMSLVPRVGRIVGRKINPETGKRDDYNPDLKIEQRLESRNDEKSGTLTTVQKDNVLIDPPSYRMLTPIECERLQTMPDNYTEGVSNSQRYKMIGNGWTIDVISHILSYKY